jgi:hypothetical protein
MAPSHKRRRISSSYVDRAPSVYCEEASIVAEVLGCDLETLQITFVEMETTIHRTVDPLKYFQDPSSLITVKTFLEGQQAEQTQTQTQMQNTKNPNRLQQWMDDLETRIHLCQEQERFSQESEIICIDEDSDDNDNDDDEPNKSRANIDNREYVCTEIAEDDDHEDEDEDEDETVIVDEEDEKQEEPKEEEKPPPKPTALKVYMPTRDEMAFCCAECRCETERRSIHTIQNGDDSLYHRLCCHKIGNANRHLHLHSVFKKAGLWRCPVQLVDEQRIAALTVKSRKHKYDDQGNILYSNRDLGRQLARYQKEEKCLLLISRLELQRKVNTNKRNQQAFANADFEARKYDTVGYYRMQCIVGCCLWIT